MSEPMIVVATHRGYYGEKIRYEGERFALKDHAHFSPRWMVDPAGDKYTETHKAAEQAFAASTATQRKQGVTDEQLIAEVTQSSGVVAGLRAENLKLKEENRALRAKVDSLTGADREVRAREAGDEPDVGSTDQAETGDAGAGAAGDVTPGAEAPARRVRRTA